MKKINLIIGVILVLALCGAAFADNWERHLSGAYYVTEFDGSGEVIADYDTGCAWYHEDFGDSHRDKPLGVPAWDGCIIDYMYEYSLPYWDNVGYGTNLAGIICGSGAGDSSSGSTPHPFDAHGIAPGAKLIIQENRDLTGFSMSSTLREAIEDAWVGNDRGHARLHLNGWSSSPVPNGSGSYDWMSQEIDNIIFFNYDMAVFFPSGYSDDNPGFLAPEACAKNIISVGGFVDSSLYSMYNDIDPYAGIGPTKDNRVKPDLVGPSWYGIATTDVPGAEGYSPDDYYIREGTGAAAAYVAAVAAIVRQMYKANHFQNNPVLTADDVNPHAATLKALLIANADSLLMPLNTRYMQGWGAPNLWNIYNIGPFYFIVDETQDLTNGSNITYDVVATGESDLRITLAWTDYPGQPLQPALVNDLNLEVSQGDTVWYGNMGLETNYYSVSGPGNNEWHVGTNTNYDNINNVENVFIPVNLAKGSFRITVRGAQITNDTQNFALVASGVFNEISGVPIAHNQYVETLQDTPIGITLSASDINGDPLTYSIVESPFDGTLYPINGTLSGNAPNLTYTPNAGFLGWDAIYFKANDGNLDSPIA